MERTVSISNLPDLATVECFINQEQSGRKTHKGREENQSCHKQSQI